MEDIESNCEVDTFLRTLHNDRQEKGSELPWGMHACERVAHDMCTCIGWGWGRKEGAEMSGLEIMRLKILKVRSQVI